MPPTTTFIFRHENNPHIEVCITTYKVDQAKKILGKIVLNVEDFQLKE